MKKHKYELTNETITIDNGKTLYRIRALIGIEAFGVKIGDLGGYIEKEYNLSHDGNAWVSDNAIVYGDARIYDNAIVYDDARIYGYARIYGNATISGNAMIYGNAWVSDNAIVYDDARIHGYARIYDNAIVCDNTEVCGNAEVYGTSMICGNVDVFGNARIFGNVKVHGNAWIYGDAMVYGNTWVCGDARVCGDAEINKVAHVLTIGPIGSRNSTTTFFRTKENIIKVKCGCFYGTIDEFLAKVELTHRNNKHGQAYRIAAELAKAQIDLE